MRLPLVVAFFALGAAPVPAQDRPVSGWLAIRAAAQDLTAADEVTFDFVEGRLAGRSGCNRYFADADLTARNPAAGRIALGPIIATRMVCPGRGSEVEAAFLGALSGVDGWLIEADGTLVLTAEGAERIRARRR